MSSRSDAEILELLRSARPDEAAMDATAARFAATRPAVSFTAPAFEAGSGRGDRDARQRRRSVSITVAAAAVVVAGAAAALVALRSTATDPSLVPATQTTEAPEEAHSPPATWVGPDGGVVVAPSPEHAGQPASEGEVTPSGGEAAPVPSATTPAAPVVPGGTDAAPSVPPAAAPDVGIVPNATVAGRSPLPFCGTIVADHISLVDAAQRAMAACFWTLVDAGVPAEVIWTGTDAAGRPFAMVARHVGDRRGETYKLHPDASGTDAWFVQRCTNLRPGADLLSMDPAQTRCGGDVPI